MDASGQPQERPRADALVHHLSWLERADETRPSAYERLSDTLGPELAQLLVCALTADRAAPARSAA